MGSWGIANTAPDNEKIKAEVSDYLGGLNSTGKIDYLTYSEAFDFIMDAMDRLYALPRHQDDEAKAYKAGAAHDSKIIHEQEDEIRQLKAYMEYAAEFLKHHGKDPDCVNSIEHYLRGHSTAEALSSTPEPETVGGDTLLEDCYSAIDLAQVRVEDLSMGMSMDRETALKEHHELEELKTRINARLASEPQEDTEHAKGDNDG